MCNHPHRIKETNRTAQVGDITTKWIFCYAPKRGQHNVNFPCRIIERRCDILGLEYSVWWHKYGVRCHKIECPKQLTKQSCDQVHKSVVARQCTCGCDEGSTRVCHLRCLRAGVMEGRIFCGFMTEQWGLKPDGVMEAAPSNSSGSRNICVNPSPEIRNPMGLHDKARDGKVTSLAVR